MTDIVERLLAPTAHPEQHQDVHDPLRLEAAAGIVRLRAVLRPLLEHYLECYDGNKDQLALDAERLLS